MVFHVPLFLCAHIKKYIVVDAIGGRLNRSRLDGSNHV